jgi:hypothetical protein
MQNISLERKVLFETFLKKNGYEISSLNLLKGDASRRKFYRLKNSSQSLIVIDANPDIGEEPNAYVAITYFLEKHHFSVPKIHAFDINNGFLIVEDFGDTLYSVGIKNGADEIALYKKALDVLVALNKISVDPVLSYGEGTYKVQNYDVNRYLSEIKIFSDWYFPKITKRPMPLLAKDELNTIFKGLLLPVINQSSSLVLRDYHADNLMILQERKSINSVGLLDFQDAVIGNHAYDVVSLLQDARRDISDDFEKKMLDYYLSEMNITDTHFFMRDYYILGVQRNIKIIGIFMRLWLRDGKAQYLSHIERVWRYLEKDLQQPILNPLNDWFERWLPRNIRIDLKAS